MVSELLRLTEAERRRLTELVVAKAQEGGAASVIGCGAESTFTAVNHAKHADRHGADAVMVIPPTTVILDDEAILHYYSAIGDAIGTQLIVQDAGGYVGKPMSIEVQVRLFDTAIACTSRVYFKPEADPIGPRLSPLRAATGGEARVLEGAGGARAVDSFRPRRGRHHAGSRCLLGHQSIVGRSVRGRLARGVRDQRQSQHVGCAPDIDRLLRRRREASPRAPGRPGK
jgi:hypothetical protein